jgi:hypothetical protein
MIMEDSMSCTRCGGTVVMEGFSDEKKAAMWNFKAFVA